MEEIQTETFKDYLNGLIGLEKQKEELKKCLESTRPKSILVYSPPGLGKTLLLKSICAENHLKPLFMNSSNFVFNGAELTKILFEQAYLSQPCLVVLDDLETLFINQDASFKDAISNIQENFTKILSDHSAQIVLVGITNRPFILTNEFRELFQVGIELEHPRLEDREEILKINLKNEPSINDKTLHEIALATDLFSGADLSTLARDIQMHPLKKYFRSTHFRLVDGGGDSAGSKKYQACTKDDKDAVELDPYEIDKDMMIFEPLNEDEILNIVKSHKPTINMDEILQFKNFSEKCFNKTK